MKEKQRNPAGLDSRNPIALRLMPEELRDARDISGQIGVSKAKLAREAYLRGLPLVCHDRGIILPASENHKSEGSNDHAK